MTRDEVEKKALDLLAPVLGGEKSRKLIEAVWNIEGVKNACDLRPLLMI